MTFFASSRSRVQHILSVCMLMEIHGFFFLLFVIFNQWCIPNKISLIWILSLIFAWLSIGLISNQKRREFDVAALFFLLQWQMSRFCLYGHTELEAFFYLSPLSPVSVVIKLSSKIHCHEFLIRIFSFAISSCQSTCVCLSRPWWLFLSVEVERAFDIYSPRCETPSVHSSFVCRWSVNVVHEVMSSGGFSWTVFPCLRDVSWKVILTLSMYLVYFLVGVGLFHRIGKLDDRLIESEEEKSSFLKITSKHDLLRLNEEPAWRFLCQSEEEEHRRQTPATQSQRNDLSLLIVSQPMVFLSSNVTLSSENRSEACLVGLFVTEDLFRFRRRSPHRLLYFGSSNDVSLLQHSDLFSERWDWIFRSSSNSDDAEEVPSVSSTTALPGRSLFPHGILISLLVVVRIALSNVFLPRLARHRSFPSLFPSETEQRSTVLRRRHSDLPSRTFDRLSLDQKLARLPSSASEPIDPANRQLLLSVGGSHDSKVFRRSFAFQRRVTVCPSSGWDCWAPSSTFDDAHSDVENEQSADQRGQEHADQHDHSLLFAMYRLRSADVLRTEPFSNVDFLADRWRGDLSLSATESRSTPSTTRDTGGENHSQSAEQSTVVADLQDTFSFIFQRPDESEMFGESLVGTGDLRRTGEQSAGVSSALQTHLFSSDIERLTFFPFSDSFLPEE